jgi:putative hemolysin
MKQKKNLLIAAVIIIIVAVVAVALMLNMQVQSASTQIANPASQFCQQHGYNVQIETAIDGSQSGNCVSPSGRVCEEWAYFRGECSLG